MDEAPGIKERDQIWADEPNIMVRFEHLDNEKVRITIINVEGSMGFDGRVLAKATLGAWRWARAVQAMKEGHA